jgi:hypothetical protein
LLPELFFLFGRFLRRVAGVEFRPFRLPRIDARLLALLALGFLLLPFGPLPLTIRLFQLSGRQRV